VTKVEEASKHLCGWGSGRSNRSSGGKILHHRSLSEIVLKKTIFCKEYSRTYACSLLPLVIG